GTSDFICVSVFALYERKNRNTKEDKVPLCRRQNCFSSDDCVNHVIHSYAMSRFGGLTALQASQTERQTPAPAVPRASCGTHLQFGARGPARAAAAQPRHTSAHPASHC